MMCYVGSEIMYMVECGNRLYVYTCACLRVSYV